MTENEALKIHIEDCEKRIERIKGFMESNCDADISECCRNVRILENSIQALEEIQQYRAIGTVEELQSKLEAYRELGTMEELKALKEKSVAKKPNKDEFDRFTCPDCGWIVSTEEYGGRFLPHCENCGQAIDYSE